MILIEPKVTRLENGKKTYEISASTLELFSEDDTMYGENIDFSAFNNQGLLSAMGSANLMYADNQNEIFALLNDVKVQSFEHNVQLSSSGLYLDNQKEQLVSGKNDVVHVVRNSSSDSEVRFIASGTGFSMSLVRMEYEFEKNISGIIETD